MNSIVELQQNSYKKFIRVKKDSKTILGLNKIQEDIINYLAKNRLRKVKINGRISISNYVYIQNS